MEGANEITWRVRARNDATESENRIHDDAVARQYGFRGGLVPGVTVFAYMTRPVAEAWGRDWLERGTIRARFDRPAYEGDDLEIVALPTANDTLELVSRNAEGTVCARGAAGFPAESKDPPSLADYPLAPLPDAAPPVSREALASIETLGSVEMSFHASEAPGYLDLVGDDLPLYREAGVAHPGWLLQGANWILATNVRLGPWIHVSSDVSFFRTVRDGERVSTRGRVASLFERKGHELVELDLLWVTGDTPVAHARHTAIYRIRRR